MLELAILGLLHESPMHGYELRKQLVAPSSARSGRRSATARSTRPCAGSRPPAGSPRTRASQPGRGGRRRSRR